MELDSGTAEKWSRHVVIKLPGAAFADNSEVKRFVLECVLKHPDAMELLIMTQAGDVLRQTDTFVDTAVYSMCAAWLDLHFFACSLRQTQLWTQPPTSCALLWLDLLP